MYFSHFEQNSLPGEIPTKQIYFDRIGDADSSIQHLKFIIQNFSFVPFANFVVRKTASIGNSMDQNGSVLDKKGAGLDNFGVISDKLCNTKTPKNRPLGLKSTISAKNKKTQLTVDFYMIVYYFHLKSYLKANNMITREADYAIRLIQYLADQYDQPTLTSITAISKQMQIPYHHLRLVGTKLAAAGLITSRRGHSGGYKLNHPPSEISLFDVITTVDSKCLLINLCLHQDTSCQRDAVCKVHLCLEDLQNNLNQSLSNITFDQLAQQ